MVIASGPRRMHLNIVRPYAPPRRNVDSSHKAGRLRRMASCPLNGQRGGAKKERRNRREPVEQTDGFEPSSPAYKAGALPLSYASILRFPA